MANVPNQPLFASSSKLSADMEHLITINITSVVAKPYIFQSFFVGPNQGSANMDGVVTSVPPANSAIATSASTSAKSTTSATPTSQAASNKSASPSQIPADTQKTTIKILGVLLGISLFFIASTIIFYAIIRRRAQARQKIDSAKSTENAEKSRPGMHHVFSVILLTKCLSQQKPCIRTSPPPTQFCDTIAIVTFGRLFARLEANLRAGRLLSH